MEISQRFMKYNDQKFKHHVRSDDLKTLHQLKLYLDDIYYNTDESTFPDYRYDILKRTLVKRDPDYVPPVGAKIRVHENRVRIPYYMGSTSKITPNDQKDLDRWLADNKCEHLLITEKLDGVSGLFVCKNGKNKLYTRGDGTIGADISYVIQYIDTIPDIKDMEENIVVRGELIIEKKAFDMKYKYDGVGEYRSSKGYGRTYKHSRNMVTGLIGAKTVREGLQDLQFIVYEIVGDETMPRPSSQLRKLERLGFRPAMNKKIRTTNNMDDYVALHNEFKEKSDFEIDGIVVQSNVAYDRNRSGNPSYLFAFKVCGEDTIVETTVLDIEWSVSSWGQIIPVAILDPVDLPGVTISRVTLSNAGLMQERKIGPGAIVNVTRSKEVIPYIVDVIEECDELKWPDREMFDFVWDDNRVHLKVTDAGSDIIATMRIKMFSKFFAKMGIKHVSQATVKKMYDHGIDTLLKIIAAKQDDLVEIEGIQKKSAARIVTNIHNGLQEIKASELLGASGVFGFGVGRKRVIQLMTDIPDLLVADKEGLRERIMEVEGFSEIMASKVYNNIDIAVAFVDAISPYVSFQTDTRVSDVLVGKKFVFSGFRSKEMEQKIVDRGGKVTTSVSKKTSGLIVNSKNSGNSKEKKASKLGVPIYSREEFEKELFK